MTCSRQIFVALALAATATVARAADAGWQGKGEAGIVLARGNTDARTVNLKLAMSEESGDWKHALEIAALRAANAGVTSADRYMAGWQSDYRINARAFGFGGLRYENDKFSGFDYQASVSTGLGYKFYNTEKMQLSAQVGVGYRRLQETATGKASGNAVLVGGFDYQNVLTATTKLVDKFHVESGADNTLLVNFLGLEVKMSTALALAVGLDAHQNTNPPAGKKQLDLTTTLNVVYAF
jgi:putative salt-induced outer membrane protein